ncbi:unnamed protein product [Caenorhabditis auriculariae]|uniref:Serpentine receptor class gamma n=1 Tax=Caenorhabditis auriculariae TaxID=2777116 RepID=A0A8S1HVB0_9PELO|nr:unnamed protein product [Caenorhabditis auriculariae]
MVFLAFLSLNRLLVFVFPSANSVIFERKLFYLLTIVLTTLTVLSTILAIHFSELTRLYLPLGDAIDRAAVPEIMRVANRLYIIFPAFSILCYTALFIYFHRKYHDANVRKAIVAGERQILVQLFVISASYVTLFTVWEILNNVTIETTLKLKFIAFLNVIDTIPEFFIPIFLIFGTNNFKHIPSDVLKKLKRKG